MKFSLNLVENNSEIRQKILNAMQDIINNAIDNTIKILQKNIKNLIIDALKSEPEYSSLINGELKREFGISDTSNVDTAIDTIASSVKISKNTIKINNAGLSGGIEISIINNQDYGGALSDYSGKVIDNDRGYSLPWLEWLLLKGNQIIVKNYEVKLGSNPRSRSGDAIMIASSSNWRVPPQFAGTIKDNWTTRALSMIETKISNLIKTTFESNI
jgi:hypothetical protein